jgi:hypothetical protein
MKHNTHIIMALAASFSIICMILVPDRNRAVSEDRAESQYTGYLSRVLMAGSSSSQEKGEADMRNMISTSNQADQIQEEQTDEAADSQPEPTAAVQNSPATAEQTETIRTEAADTGENTAEIEVEEEQAVSEPVPVEAETSVSQAAVTEPAAAETETPVSQPAVMEGTAGHLAIAALGIDVPLYSAYDDAQTIVDAEQSAAYMDWYAVPVIADHAAQNNFRNIAAAAGQAAVITRGGMQTAYVCTGVYQGENNGDDLIVNGESFLTGGHGDLIMYTCMSADEGRMVYVTVWNRM